ncbi:hypothetical protein [Hyphomicrobium sulfonivorans]|uniref:hypothetical protein n=1 Tax=Hyphomicrobium sulfonivorans TaxID=121290 RepID=UPI00156F7810|nr:hypothetical protein [Hyphomicrobium sulfonivorans]MBI1650546.1 hypothetical protein [Hyphomicrobium sulfonivorans]NSL72096.1 hypothetical protein [Hyphomicrobium sulfonivorans]
MPPRSKLKQRQSATPAKGLKPGPAAPSEKAQVRATASAGAGKAQSQTKALNISEPVRRQPVARTGNDAAGLEQSLLDRQLDYVGALLAWTPTRVLLAQNAAFWAGVSGSDGRKADTKADPAKDGGDRPGKAAAQSKPSPKNAAKARTAAGTAEATEGQGPRRRAKRRG